MAHKCFISFKAEDFAYKKHIQDNLDVDMVDKSLDEAIDSNDEDYIMQKIREDYLSDSTVTIHLIGAHSAENSGKWEQRYIKRELQASFYNGKNNSRNGVLGVVLPSMESSVFNGKYACSTCGGEHNLVAINNGTVVREFSYNYYIPNGKCCHQEDEHYCILITWEDFCSDPERHIHRAYEKRTAPIAEKVKVYP